MHGELGQYSSEPLPSLWVLNIKRQDKRPVLACFGLQKDVENTYKVLYMNIAVLQLN